MDTYLISVTFPDLDTATGDAGSLLDSLRTAGLSAQFVGGPDDSEDDASRPDPGTTTRELHVRAASADEARSRVTEVVDGRFPPGMVLLGAPTKL